MRDPMPSKVNITGVGQLQLLFQKNKRQFKSYSILAVFIGEQFPAVANYIVVVDQSRLPLHFLIKRYTVIPIGKLANYYCKNKDEDAGQKAPPFSIHLFKITQSIVKQSLGQN